jgi:hypothetical protein
MAGGSLRLGEALTDQRISEITYRQPLPLKPQAQLTQLPATRLNQSGRVTPRR